MVPGIFLVTRKTNSLLGSLRRGGWIFSKKQAANQVMVPVLAKELEKKIDKPQRMLCFMDQAIDGRFEVGRL